MACQCLATSSVGVVEVVVSVKNHIGYSNQDTFWVELDGDKVHGIIGARESLNKF